MYCVMRASVPSLYNVYRRYDRKIAARCTTRLARSRSPIRRMHGIVGERERSNCMRCIIIYSYKHVLRSKHVIVGTFTCIWGMKYICSMMYKACS